ncbi:MAG TPA: DbpA RNA binding domain-containing protein, partial [Candidatus Kapabacteria bacterium]|nr:DbpA RNA binding domain-containing protein [Candidatus Kapabacteria bacterium]
AEETPSPLMHSIVEQLCQEMEMEHEQLCSVLVNLLQADLPLEPKETVREHDERGASYREGRGERESRREREYDETPIEHKPVPLKEFPDIEMERFRIEVGKKHGAKPGDIVGAIANELELESSYIGEINMRGEYSTVDLPEGMPKELLGQLKTIRVRQQQLRATRYGKEEPGKGNKAFAPQEDARTGKKKFDKPRRERPARDASDHAAPSAQADTAPTLDPIESLLETLTRARPVAEKTAVTDDAATKLSRRSSADKPAQKISYKEKSAGEKPFREKSFKAGAARSGDAKESGLKDRKFKDKPSKDKPFKEKSFKDKPFKGKTEKGKTFADKTPFKGKPKPKKS